MRGATNMELDRALWHAAEAGECSDLLMRLYRWQPPAVSLGFHQPAAAVDAEAATRLGVEVVRRPTGGAAVLHWNEWTYAVVGPLGLPGFGRRPGDIYAAVGACLVAALRAVGVDADLAGSGRPAGVACFAALGGHEIQVGGRKLVGSALRRGRRAFLQHGSVLVGPEHALLGQLLAEGGAGDAAASTVRYERLALETRTTNLGRLGIAVLDGERLAVPFAAALAARAGVEGQRVDDSARLLPAWPPGI